MVGPLILVLAGVGGAASSAELADPAVHRPPPAPASLTQGSNDVTWTVKLVNRGATKAKPVAAGVYLSRDATKSKGDVLLGKSGAKALPVGAKRSVVVRLNVPATTKIANYRLIACALPSQRQRQATTRNDCVAARARTAVVAPPPAAPTIATISEGGRGSTLRPVVEGGGVPPGATVTAYGSATCSGPAVGTGTGTSDGTFEVGFAADIDWGATVSMAVRVTTGTGTSGCSNALSYVHRGQTYTWTGSDWTGPATIPVDSLVRLLNSPGAIPHFTDSPVALPPHGNVGTPGATYYLDDLSVGHYAWYDHSTNTDNTGSFTAQ
jgi:hypothetical protein